MVVDNSRFKRQIRKVMQAGKSSSISKSLARKAGKAKLVVKQEKLDVGFDQALLATKYQVDQVAIRLQPAGLGSDTITTTLVHKTALIPVQVVRNNLTRKSKPQ